MSFSAKLRKNETAYKLVKQVVEHICTTNGLEFKTVWATVSNREPAVFDRHFRRERKRADPLNNVKKPRTAFSFFTQEQRPKISEKNPTMPFGEVSKLVGQQWAALDAAVKAGYLAQEAEDKKRYEVERVAVLKACAAAADAANATSEASAVAAEVVAPVAAVAETVAAPAAKGKRAAPKATEAVSAAPAAETVAAPAAKATKKAAPAPAAATPAATPAAAAVVVAVAATPAKKGGKRAATA
jgi:hypothetical protein